MQFSLTSSKHALATHMQSRFAFRPSRPLARAAAPRLTRHTGPVRVNALAIGDKMPENIPLSYFNEDDTISTMDLAKACAGKKVVLFAVPGAFTPTCSNKHLPGFIEKSDEMKEKGVDMVGCVSVNDVFVMHAWGDGLGANDKVQMLADGSALFTKALGVELDLTDKGLGTRSRRYSMLLEDGVVTVLNLEEGGAFTVSGAEDILEALS